MSAGAFAPPGDRAALETGADFTPRFDANGLIPAIAQNADTGEVLMMAWMNAEALARTIDTGEAWYWSRSRMSLWRKGETSGHVQTVEEVRTDCDQDVILLRVRQAGAACHRGYDTCFYRRVASARDLAFRRDRPAVDPARAYGAPE